MFCSDLDSQWRFAVRKMQNFTKWSRGDRGATYKGKSLGNTKRGLAECGDMDRQLAQVASTKFGDVHVGLLDEIFQCMFFMNLLRYRR